jgi:transposase-like protein
MIAITVICRHCGSPNLTKYGIAPNGKQKYLCRTCERQSRANPGTTAYSEQQRETILRAYQERSSLRGLERTFGVARSTVIGWLKKAQCLTTLTQTLVPAVLSDPSSITLELDELWSFVGKKTEQRWIWLALCRKTRQIVGFVIGDRSEITCQKLWDALPQAYRRGTCYVIQISGAPIKRLSLKNSTNRAGKRVERPRMSSGLTIHCASVWHASYGRRFRSQNPI